MKEKNFRLTMKKLVNKKFKRWPKWKREVALEYIIRLYEPKE